MDGNLDLVIGRPLFGNGDDGVIYRLLLLCVLGIAAMP